MARRGVANERKGKFCDCLGSSEGLVPYMLLQSSNAAIAECSSLDLLILGHLDTTRIYYWIKFSRGRMIPKLLPRRYVTHSFLQLSNKFELEIVLNSINQLDSSC